MTVTKFRNAAANSGPVPNCAPARIRLVAEGDVHPGAEVLDLRGDAEHVVVQGAPGVAAAICAQETMEPSARRGLMLTNSVCQVSRSQIWSGPNRFSSHWR